MVIRTFYFEGKNSKVIDVGLRPSIIRHATSIYNLKTVAHNLKGKMPDQDRVEVIVKGEEESIHLFHDYVSKNDIRKKREGPRPEVSKLLTYKGKEPDWNYCLNTVNAEQMDKGIDALTEIGGGIGDMRGSLNSIDEKFGDMLKRYGEFGKDMKEMKNSLGYLGDIRNVLVSLLDKDKK